MKRIHDERLKLQNLKNIRIVYILQTLGLLSILGYDLFIGGFDEMRANPLWFILSVTVGIYLYLSMNISIDYEERKRTPKQSFILSSIVLMCIAITIGTLIWFTNGNVIVESLIMVGIIVICGLIPIIYIFYLRKTRN